MLDWYAGVSISLDAVSKPTNRLTLKQASILLVLISIYDMIAVWKSKHMITLAKFQLDTKSFAGLAMNYR